MEKKIKQYKLYRIYSDNCLLYIGKTKQALQAKLFRHFSKTLKLRPINIDCVHRIEYTTLLSEADANVYEVYYINKLKPALNCERKADDELMVCLPELIWHEYDLSNVEEWKDRIHVANRNNEEIIRRRKQIEVELEEKRKELSARKDLSTEKRAELMAAWIKNYYEPARNNLL